MASQTVLLLTLLVCLARLAEAQQNGELIHMTVPVGWIELANSENNIANILDLPSAPNDQVKIQYVNVNGLPVLVQFTYTGPPKILPIATADSYPEGSSINLICTVSGGQRKGLTLSWKMNGEDLDDERMRYSSVFDNVSIGTDDADISILRIKNATNRNSGQYTCTARNPLGQDSTSVKIVINGRFKYNCDSPYL